MVCFLFKLFTYLGSIFNLPKQSWLIYGTEQILEKLEKMLKIQYFKMLILLI